MIQKKYSLDNRSGKKKFNCPSCNRFRTFTRYIDLETLEYISEIVGKCDRENNCCYHYTPKQYFLDNNIQTVSGNTATKKQFLPRKIDFIDEKYILASTRNVSERNNCFFSFLSERIGKTGATNVSNNYKLGNSNKWNGANVFWYIDIEQKVRYGKIMQYDPDSGRRVKKPYNHIASVPDELIKKRIINSFNKSICLFGEHQLSDKPPATVAIVESEKTAMIMSHNLPQFIWLATGGAGWLNTEKCRVLKGRNVILFPDLGKCNEIWQQKAKVIRTELGLNIIVNQYLQLRANLSDIEDGFDLGDYIY